jgi:aspartate-semialdehyde dehydrogenase
VSDGVRVALVGATGVVGQEILKLLVQRKFKLKDLVCLADPSEEGTKIKFGEETLTVRGAREDSFTGIDIAFFAVGTEVSNYFAPLAVKKNCRAISNSSWASGFLRCLTSKSLILIRSSPSASLNIFNRYWASPGSGIA